MADKLRLVIIVDRVEGTIFPAILNTINNTYAAISDEIKIKKSTWRKTDYDCLFDSINEACDAIQKFANDLEEIPE